MLVNEPKMRRYVARNLVCQAGLLELLMSWTPLRVVFHESRWAIPRDWFADDAQRMCRCARNRHFWIAPISE